MAGIWGVTGQKHSIAITHWDGREDLHPVAYIYDELDTLLNTISLVHRAKGYYSVCWSPADSGIYNVVIITYDDVGHLVRNEETQEEGRTYFINNLLSMLEGLAGEVASAVWDEILPGEHDLTHSAGLFMQVIRETVLQTNWEIISNATWGLPVLGRKILDNRTILSAEINDSELKIDDLSALTVANHLESLSEIQINRNAISSLDSHLSSVETSIIGEINSNEIKIDSILNAINNIQNNTRFVAVVPQKMRIPDTLSNAYQFFLAVYDVSGNPEAPDQTPRVRVVKSDGVELVPFTSMDQDGMKVGQYYYTHLVTTSAQENILRVEFEVIENTVTTYLSRVSETVIYDSNMDAIENKIDIIDSNVDGLTLQLTGSEGLTVINSKLDNVVSEVNQNEVVLGQIKVKTDLIISNPVSTDNTDALSVQMGDLPSIVDIQNRLDTQSDSIKGPDARNLTEVHDNERGTDNALLANDPRLAFLDATISSRSDYNISDIWSYATRTLTDAPPLSSTEIAKIWDHLTGNILVNGSIGSFILDMIDAPVSSRSTLTMAQLISALGPLALEASVSTVLSTVVNENNENEALIRQALDALYLIKPQTDKIVDDGARHTDLVQEIDENQALIAGLDLLSRSIKDKTDLLHGDIAHQSDLLSIPLNPLLSTDGRLDNLYLLSRLDVAVSTRAEDFPADYAKAVELEDVKNDIIAEVNMNEMKISDLPTDTEMDNKLVRMDNILIELGAIKGLGFDTLLHSLTKIKEGQGGSGPGGTITAQDVWEYGQRGLTEYPAFATADQLDIVENTIIEALPEYRCWMTTTFITQSDIQEVLCWVNKDGHTLADSTSARVVISDGTNDLWSGSSLAPDARGVFRIAQTNISGIINEADRNFVISITIEYSGKDYNTVQPFYTVG